MNMKELQNMSEQELTRTLAQLREQVRDLSFKVHSREVKNNHLLKNVKQDIARILTLVHKK